MRTSIRRFLVAFAGLLSLSLAVVSAGNAFAQLYETRAKTAINELLRGD